MNIEELKELAESAKHSISQGHKRYQAEADFKDALAHETILELIAQLEDAQSENRALLATEQNLREELEVERVRLAACGVVAMSNTRESAAKARKMLPQYESASCMDVARAVDAEMDLRERVKELEEGLRVASQIIGHPDDSFSQHIGALLEQQK